MSTHTNDMIRAYADALSAYDALTADPAALKESMRKGFGTLLALRDVEEMSGRQIAELDGCPVGTSQVARDLRAAEILAQFGKADPKDVKKATDLLTAAKVKEALAAKNPLTALMEAAGIKKEQRRGPQKKKTDPNKKTDNKKTDAPEDITGKPEKMPAAVEAIVRGFVKAVEDGTADADLVARMRTVLQHADQMVAGARVPVEDVA